jgi:hypothetical protein
MRMGVVMRNLRLTLAVLASLVLAACGGGGNSSSSGGSGGGTPVQTGTHVVTAWGELGMHCMDGKDYSVFSVLPPYNILHAQVVRRTEPPSLVTSGITVTYEAVADSTGSINSSSAGKTNFWTYVQALFLKNVAAEVGLTGVHTQGTSPQPMTFNAAAGYWEAVGIPTVPFDDSGARNPYPMAKVVVRDSGGTILATTNVVLAVSDEITCNVCHASNSNVAAQPAAGWENNPDPAKDMKFNILKKHDDVWNVSAQVAALKPNYNYQNSLYQTAKSGTPVLCAACHASNALGTTGVAGANQLTQDMHKLHGPLVYPASGTTLDNATSPTNSCYLCHPGQTTKCQRGAMNKTACFDCHGNLTKVGASTRQGWLDLPACQMCHTNSNRYATTFDTTGNWRTSSDTRFATTPNAPVANKSLYRASTGHGNLYCSACHGSTHAEYPTLQANDNMFSTGMQGYAGKIIECTACHASMPSTNTGGPHGMHTIGSDWVRSHRSYADGSGRNQCAYCHGSDFRGSPLSAIATAKVLNGKSFSAGHQMNCYDCHNGPSGD